MIPRAIVVARSWVVSVGSAVDTETFWMSLQISLRKVNITSSTCDPQLGDTGPSIVHSQPSAFCTAHSGLDLFLLRPWLSILEQFFWYFFLKIFLNILYFSLFFLLLWEEPLPFLLKLLQYFSFPSCMQP